MKGLVVGLIISPMMCLHYHRRRPIFFLRFVEPRQHARRPDLALRSSLRPFVVMTVSVPGKLQCELIRAANNLGEVR